MSNLKIVLSSAIQTFRLKIIDRKRLVFIIISLSLFILYNLNGLCKYSYIYSVNFNIYNFILYVLNDFINISFIFTSGFLLLIVELSNFKTVESFIIVRNESRVLWYISKICSIIISAIFFVITIVGICIITGCQSMGFNNNWDKTVLKVVLESKKVGDILKISSELLNNVTPLQGIVISMVLITLYLVLIGTLNFIINLIVKNVFQGFFLTQIFMIICLIAYKKQFISNKLYKLTSLKNIILQDMSLENYNDIIFSLGYFIVFILVLVLIGLRRFKKLDLDISDSVN